MLNLFYTRQSKIGIDNSVAFESDRRSPMQCEIDLDYQTDVNYAHWIRNLLVYFYDTKFDSFNYSVMNCAAWKSNLPDE